MELTPTSWSGENHRIAKIRAEGAAELEKLGLDAVEAVPVLLELLVNDSDASVRSSAARAVARIGYYQSEVFVALCGAMSEDESDIVRATARIVFLHAVSRRREELAFTTHPSYKEASIWGDDGDGGITFRGPNWVAVDGEDNVYVTEFFGNRVQKFNSDGLLLAQWGSSGFGDGEFGGPNRHRRRRRRQRLRFRKRHRPGPEVRARRHTPVDLGLARERTRTVQVGHGHSD